MLHRRLNTIVPRALALAKILAPVMNIAEHQRDSGDVQMFALLMMLEASQTSARRAYEGAAPGPDNGGEVVAVMRRVFEQAIADLNRGAWPAPTEPQIILVPR